MTGRPTPPDDPPNSTGNTIVCDGDEDGDADGDGVDDADSGVAEAVDVDVDDGVTGDAVGVVEMVGVALAVAVDVLVAVDVPVDVAVVDTVGVCVGSSDVCSAVTPHAAPRVHMDDPNAPDDVAVSTEVWTCDCDTAELSTKYEMRT